ncbi:MAG TPA: hypothetical protein VNK89_08185 [Thermoflexus sp.]|nr:hypothetical protein [Thermoflexus sp.]
MIRDPETWKAFEAEWQRQTPADPARHFRIFDLLLEIARDLGAWPPADPLEGIEVDLRIAQALRHDVRISAE